MESWGFLTSHARVLLRIAQDPGTRLRDIAAAVGITERSRRNSYQIQAHLPFPEPTSQEPAIGDVLALLMGGDVKRRLTEGRPA
jgi:hypothetical protein